MEDLLWSLDRLASLPKQAARWKWAKPRADELDDRSTLELLEIVGEHLAGEDRLVLAQLDTGADEHNLVLVAKKDAERLVDLGKQAKYGDVDLFTGSELGKFQREREKKEKGERAREAVDPDAQRQFLHADGRVWLTYGRHWGSGADARYALEIVTGKLGHETHSRGESETRISASAKAGRWLAGARKRSPHALQRASRRSPGRST